MTGPARYVELDTTTSFSFHHGASMPDELALRAAFLGHPALAVTDRNTLAGIVRAWTGCKTAGIRLVVGCRLDFEDAASLLVYPTDRDAYGRLCRLLSLGRQRAEKGHCQLFRADLEEYGAGLIAILIPPDYDTPEDDALRAEIAAFRPWFPELFLAARCRLDGRDDARLWRLAAVAEEAGTPLVATNGVLMHVPARRPLLDVFTCIREHTTVEAAGWRLAANAERHLKTADEMALLFRRYPEAIARTVEIAGRATFDLAELRYEYPDEPVPPGSTPIAELTRLTYLGAAAQYPQGIPEKIVKTIEYELKIIGDLNYAAYFLTVADIVRFARSQNILCQGRGSAANSTVCYCLGVTAVDPTKVDLLFERFVSAARNEPPDIDVDFEHERREEVIQYIYRRYGRRNAGLTATVIRYRTRSALREVGKALGLSEDIIASLLSTVWSTSSEHITDDRIRECGLDPHEPRLRLALDLAQKASGFPRHLSQHVGGFVLTRGPLDELVPVENARMADRTIIQWDKDDLDALGLLKVDVLALGMLTCIRKAFEMVKETTGTLWTLTTLPDQDEATYDMLCAGDSLGVFQVESRAQMAMLPRLKPRNFYDLVIEVAIVRPGPIQGDMVHPFLRRRQKKEKAEYPLPALKEVLVKTLGVPLFQEQAMKIAIIGAGFTPEEADQLRRAMAAFRRTGHVERFRDKFLSGMIKNGCPSDFAEKCFRQIEGFGEYGFPESHSASFAHLVYASAWLKRHHPAAFTCALLNSQPMGFYAPSQIIIDAERHGVEVRPVDINASDWDCTLEKTAAGGIALRLGFRQIKGLPGSVGSEAVTEIIAKRGSRPYLDPEDVWQRAKAAPSVLERLAAADVFAGLGLSRRDALWAIKPLKAPPLPLFAAVGHRDFAHEDAVSLPELGIGEQVVEDYASLRLTLRAHPVSLLRAGLEADGVIPASRLPTLKTGSRVRVGGLIICRQRPGSARGILFLTLEDDTGIANVIVWKSLYDANRRTLLRGRLLAVDGTLQSEDGVIHIVGHTFHDFSDRLLGLTPDNRLLTPVTMWGDRGRHMRPAGTGPGL